MTQSTTKTTHLLVLFGLLFALILFLIPNIADAQLKQLGNETSCEFVCDGDYIYDNNDTPNNTKDDSCLCAGNADYTLATATRGLGIFARLINILIGIVVSLAFLFFFWNLAKYIRDENEHEEAKKRMGWAVLAIVVITSLWGLVAFVRNIVGINAGEANDFSLPTVWDSEGTSVFNAKRKRTEETNNTSERFTDADYRNYDTASPSGADCEDRSGTEKTRCANSQNCHTADECAVCHNPRRTGGSCT